MLGRWAGATVPKCDERCVRATERVRESGGGRTLVSGLGTGRELASWREPDPVAGGVAEPLGAHWALTALPCGEVGWWRGLLPSLPTGWGLFPGEQGPSLGAGEGTQSSPSLTPLPWPQPLEKERWQPPWRGAEPGGWAPPSPPPSSHALVFAPSLPAAALLPAASPRRCAADRAPSGAGGRARDGRDAMRELLVSGRRVGTGQRCSRLLQQRLQTGGDVLPSAAPPPPCPGSQLARSSSLVAKNHNPQSWV